MIPPLFQINAVYNQCNNVWQVTEDAHIHLIEKYTLVYTHFCLVLSLGRNWQVDEESPLQNMINYNQ